MSKSIVKKALEIIDDDDADIKSKAKSKSKLISIKKKKKKIALIYNEQSTFQDRKQLAQTCLTLKKMSTPVVSSDQIEQFNNYRFGGPSKRDLQQKKKKEKQEEIFTEEDFKRFEREYNPPLQKS
ncbi:unnamed protein product [Rotaria magnacalcarata]|uniref:Active regulator of SIRT1 n=3 Tax=Rotaria magnacalcarata TaxID=392030 RepID=A0A816DZ57_9BILA|nr:unnamed protein product [Rotaria magnacalcarata]CAF1643245.1 unnamed protein product [Rotaria magnacalcarata]CAF4233734.1 unnamed protein product [Rotaria magnacalcarata]